jgi:hypothetical protein
VPLRPPAPSAARLVQFMVPTWADRAALSSDSREAVGGAGFITLLAGATTTWPLRERSSRRSPGSRLMGPERREYRRGGCGRRRRDCCVAGSAIFKSPDYAAAISMLRLRQNALPVGQIP